jgi:hypothetical protein
MSIPMVGSWKGDWMAILWESAGLGPISLAIRPSHPWRSADRIWACGSNAHHCPHWGRNLSSLEKGFDPLGVSLLLCPTSRGPTNGSAGCPCGWIAIRPRTRSHPPSQWGLRVPSAQRPKSKRPGQLSSHFVQTTPAHAPMVACDVWPRYFVSIAGAGPSGLSPESGRVILGWMPGSLHAVELGAVLVSREGQR